MCISLRFTQLKSVKNNRKVKAKNPLTAVKSLIHPQVLYFLKKKNTINIMVMVYMMIVIFAGN